jgi:hypothetical protein
MWSRAFVWTAAFWMAGCGGRAVGDEGYFGDEPLPPPEKAKPTTAAASASASAPVAASAAPTPSAVTSVGDPACDKPPPGGFPNCNKEQSNAPCVAAGIGECFLKCGTELRPMPCPQTKLP